MHARLSYIIIGGTMDWVELLLKNAALRFLAEFPEFCVGKCEENNFFQAILNFHNSPYRAPPHAQN
jgi:hypothetical protein